MVRAVVWVLGATLAVSAAQMENDRLRLTIDETSGLVTVEDRAAGRSWQTLADERTTRTISVRALKDGIECALAAGDVPALSLKLKPGEDVLETALTLVEDLRLSMTAE